MKKIILVVLLGTSCAHGKPGGMIEKTLKAASYSPLTCQIASAVTAGFLSGFMKSCIPNETVRGGLGVLALLGSIWLHKNSYQPALQTYFNSIKDDEPLPLGPTAVTFACNTLAWAAIWSSPSLIETSVKYLDKAKLGNAAKSAAPAALVGYGASLYASLD